MLDVNLNFFLHNISILYFLHPFFLIKSRIKQIPFSFVHNAKAVNKAN